MRVTFEHRHENKSCSACRDRVNERVYVVKVVKVFQNILGSQLLSDIQTFFFTHHLLTSVLLLWEEVQAPARGVEIEPTL